MPNQPLCGFRQELRAVADEQVKPQKASKPGPLVEAKVADLTGVEVDMPGGHILVRALASIMSYQGSGDIRHLPTRVVDPAAKVDLFAVHEEAGVEKACLKKSLAAAEQGSTAQPINCLGLAIR